MNDHPLSPEEFRAIYARVPRVCVDLVLMVSELASQTLANRVLLTKRTIDPKVWHLPGGTMRHGESIADAAKRIAKRELGIDIGVIRVMGALEYPSHHPHGDSPIGIPIVVSWSGHYPAIVLNEEASEYIWSTVAPPDTHVDQLQFIRTLQLGTYR